MDAVALARALEQELSALGTVERASKEKSYLASDLRHLGVRVPDVRKVAKQCLRGRDLGHDDVLALVRALWAEPVHERRLLAVELLVERRSTLTTEDLALLETMLREARTWALVDPLAATVVGHLVERVPQAGDVLDRWAVDDDFWLRRSALLALLGPLRRGGGDFARFGRYADAMLDEKEFFVRKAIGWVLRETAKSRPDLVFEWILPRASRASGVTVREAVKPLTEAQRAAVLAAR